MATGEIALARGSGDGQAGMLRGCACSDFGACVGVPRKRACGVQEEVRPAMEKLYLGCDRGELSAERRRSRSL